MINSINQFITKHSLISPESSILIGLSGGPDSVFLLHFFASYVQRGMIKHVVAAHLDHEWRADSQKDVLFCQQMTQQLGIQLVSKKISDLAISVKFNGSKEDYGRVARRHFFERVCKQHELDLIALGHHADDQEETFFIRLLRGTGIAGLGCMQPKHGRYIRPLLNSTKKEIVAYLEKNNISFLTDPSNTSDLFLRNRIRNHVIPVLHSVDNRFSKKLKAAVEDLQEVNCFLSDQAEAHFKEIAQHHGSGYSIDLQTLLNLHPVLFKKILMLWLCKENVSFPVSKAFFAEIARFLKQPGGGTHRLCPNWGILKKRGRLYIEK